MHLLHLHSQLLEKRFEIKLTRKLLEPILLYNSPYVNTVNPLHKQIVGIHFLYGAIRLWHMDSTLTGILHQLPLMMCTVAEDLLSFYYFETYILALWVNEDISRHPPTNFLPFRLNFPD